VNLPSVFQRYREEIDRELRSALSDRTFPMYDMLRYHMGWINAEGHLLPGSAGKALRPTLCLLACDAVRGDFHPALPAAASIELIHNFSLIHDDVQDGDRERRHRPTVWAIWGQPQAINAGTAMRILASLTLLRLVDLGSSLQRQLQAQRLLDGSCLRLIEGQYLDISFESRLDVTVDEYLEMIERKTATLIAASLEMGAMLGTDDERAPRAFREYGRNIGLAFQIRDDLLGIWGSEEKTGKPVGSDILRRKKTLPVLWALQQSRGSARVELERVYGGDVVSLDDLSLVLTILDGLRVQDQVQVMANRYRDRAMADIERLDGSGWARENLREMALFLTERDF
jgi:geranylgeranyl diphosphate synthase, type I